MRAFNWLKKLRQSERGNIIVIAAASMPMVIGGAALAIDTVQLELWKRQIQRAADSAAIAGAYAVAENPISATAAQTAVNADIVKTVDNKPLYGDTTALQTVTTTPGSYADRAISSETCAVRDAGRTAPRPANTPCFNRAVDVEIVAQRTMPFWALFDSRPTTIRGKSAAAVISQGKYCMVSLYDGTDTGIIAAGGANIDLNCGIATNSRNTTSGVITSGSQTQIRATPIAAVGALNGETNNFVGNTTLQPFSAPQSDPFAHMPLPPETALSNCQAFVPGPAVTPGCYTSMSIQNATTLQPGTYYINGGDFTLNANTSLNGTGVTIVMTGPGGQSGDVHINGGGTVNLTAPTATSGQPYPTILFYQDPRTTYALPGNVPDVIVNGGAGMTLEGAFYFPKADIDFSGGATGAFECLQMVGQKMKFSGSVDIDNECPGNPPGIERFVVRLVG